MKGFFARLCIHFKYFPVGFLILHLLHFLNYCNLFGLLSLVATLVIKTVQNDSLDDIGRRQVVPRVNLNEFTLREKQNKNRILRQFEISALDAPRLRTDDPNRRLSVRPSVTLS